MRVYFDSSALVCLYAREPASVRFLAVLEERRRPLLVNSLQEFEVRNAIRQKVVHSLFLEGAAAGALRAFDDDIVTGRVLRKPLEWGGIFRRAEGISRHFALRRPARAIDVLHLAVALVSGVREFVTLDAAQGEMARLSAGTRQLK